MRDGGERVLGLWKVAGGSLLQVTSALGESFGTSSPPTSLPTVVYWRAYDGGARGSGSKEDRK